MPTIFGGRPRYLGGIYKELGRFRVQGGLVAGALDAELRHPVAKGVRVEIQDRRRALRTLHHPTTLLEGSEDMISLYLFQRLEFWGCAWATRGHCR